MTKRLTLLLLDANIVIHLHQHGLWSRVVGLCDVHLARSILAEALYYSTPSGDERIDLTADVQEARLTVFDVAPAHVAEFISRFDASYADMLHPGECEALAYLMNSTDEYLICSADKIVFMVLARLGRTDQGLALEEVLDKLGLGRPLADQYSRRFREFWTKRGHQDSLRGTGLKR